jgi:hypothetical protein
VRDEVRKRDAGHNTNIDFCEEEEKLLSFSRDIPSTEGAAVVVGEKLMSLDRRHDV